MKPPKSKWFTFEGNYFSSQREPKTISGAWEKTFEKWRLIIKGFSTKSDMDACGLCNLYVNDGCCNCPVNKKDERFGCAKTPYWDWIGSNSIEDAKRELSFLRKVYKSSMSKKKVR